MDQCGKICCMSCCLTRHLNYFWISHYGVFCLFICLCVCVCLHAHFYIYIYIVSFSCIVIRFISQVPCLYLSLFFVHQIDKALDTEVVVFPCDLPAGRIISSPTGPLNNDYADVRSFSEAAKKGIAR